MTDCRITLQDIYLSIPIITPGQARLLRRPAFLSSIGGRLTRDNGKLHVDALKDISLDLTHGQNLGLIGHNGAGKTTLLRVMAGIYPATRGTVHIEGMVGCLLDGGSSNMSQDLTGRECIKYFSLIYGHARVGDWREIERDVSEFTDLGDFLDLPMRTYSAGMQSRLSAALATAWHQDILLVDEGIGAGDMAFQQKFAARLKNYMGRAGILVLASHSMDMIREYCTLGLVMKHGETQFYGKIDDAQKFYIESEQRAAAE
jgi:ABC-2 type transport system ATP-binding protein/lipopolysaccharide transport system ATP-binding protein